jgi:hypothetical protein
VADIEFDLPDFYCPMPANHYPYGQERQDRSLAWMDGFGFLADPVMRVRVESTAANMWFSLMIPHADPEYLQLLSDWCYLAFYFDDVYCPDGDARAGAGATAFWQHAGWLIRLLEAPDARSAADEPLYAAVRDLSSRFRLFATDVQLRRIAHAHRGNGCGGPAGSWPTRPPAPWSTSTPT